MLFLIAVIGFVMIWMLENRIKSKSKRKYNKNLTGSWISVSHSTIEEKEDVYLEPKQKQNYAKSHLLIDDRSVLFIFVYSEDIIAINLKYNLVENKAKFDLPPLGESSVLDYLDITAESESMIRITVSTKGETHFLNFHKGDINDKNIRICY